MTAVNAIKQDPTNKIKAMKTIIIQSYKTQHVPTWIKLCINTVKDWAIREGYDYEFFDDELLLVPPEWYREKTQNQVNLITDLSRLLYLRKMLQSYDHALWFDADVLMFDPQHFDVDKSLGFSFCREVYVDISSSEGLFCSENVNNSVSYFSVGNHFLDFYILSCQEIVKNTDREWLWHGSVGTKYLTEIFKHIKSPLICSVGITPPVLINSINDGNEKKLKFYMDNQGAPLSSVNLCASFCNKEYQGIELSNSDYEKTCELLLSSKGSVLNRFCQ